MDERITYDEEVGCWRSEDGRLFDEIAVKVARPLPAMTGAMVDPDSPEYTHPFDRSFHISYEMAQKMINEAFEVRTLGPLVSYFQPSDEILMTYGEHRRARDAQRAENYSIMRRLDALERPWWRRWFSR